MFYEEFGQGHCCLYSWPTFFFNNDFYFFYYSWFTVFYQFSAVQQSDPATHHIYTFFLSSLFDRGVDLAEEIPRIQGRKISKYIKVAILGQSRNKWL